MVAGTEHNPCGIQSFRCRDTKDLFETGHSRRFMGIAQQAILKLDQLDAATKLSQLARPPGNQLKALTGVDWGNLASALIDNGAFALIGMKMGQAMLK